MSLPQDVVIAAAVGYGAYAMAIRRAMRDLKGLRKKYDRVLAYLARHAATPEEVNEIADIIEGK